ncbi:MAG TPA: response regulator transcription factor [Streptosporangiaceae bacterium]|nr:response regulator transcription factor [Streptosporangiaceae bacterium]
MTSPLSVLVVDDQAPFRFAVKAVLRRLPCFQLAGEAKSGPEAITLVDEVHPALVLMDINMPEMNGIEATRRIVAAHPDVVVFLCSTHDVTDLPPGAPTSGARAYINKERFGADALRQLWHNRDSTPFARLLPLRPPAPNDMNVKVMSLARSGAEALTWIAVTGRSYAARGIEPLMVEPWPGRESQRTVPPMAPSRSAMLT